MSKTFIGIIALAALAGSLVAQTTTNAPATNPPAVTTPPPKEVSPPPDPKPDPNKKVLKLPVTIVAPKGDNDEKPHRPDRPGDTPPGADVKDLVERFQKAREEFIAQQKPKLIGTDAETEKLRREWLEKRAALREEFRNRAMEIRNEFRNRELQEVLDAAKDAARRSKPRVGED